MHNLIIPDHILICYFNDLLQVRGAEKEKKFVMELVQKQLEEERARLPKANPYPYTTDFPVVKKFTYFSYQI